MANQSNSTENKKTPRISKEQLKDIVEFFYSNSENYDLTIETYHKKWGEEYHITKQKLNSWLRLADEGGDKIKEQSLLTLYVFETLRKYSNPKKPMTENQIKEKIKKDHAFEGIKDDDRKLIPRHANGLVNALKGDLIKKVETPRNKAAAWYYNDNPSASYGVLTEMDSSKSSFLLGEMAFLIDMVKDSRVISSECTNALIHKLVDAVDNAERKNLVLPQNSTEASKPIIKKSDNKRYIEFNAILEKAIKDAKKVTIFDFSENEFDVTPIKIVHNSEDDKYCFVAIDKDLQSQNYSFEDIWDLADSSEDGDYPDGFDMDYKPESKSFKHNKSIALDTLFFNMREINYALKESKFLSFSYLSCKVRLTKLGETEFTYEQSPVRTLAPYKTIYKDGKPYLITIDLENNYNPEFFRIDLIQDIRSNGKVDFMDRYGVRTLQDCADNHPYPDLLPREFTEITAAFAIREDNLDRVIDAFGNKAIYCGNKKGWELGSTTVKKLSKTFSELNFSDHLGLDHNETYCVFKVQTTEEEIKRFGLEHADVVEIERPKHIRDEIKALSEKLVKRYSKKNY